MFDVFAKYLTAKVSVTEPEIERIKSACVSVKLRRGEHLLKEGEVWKHRAFISKGLLRTYRTDDKGQEHIMRFAIENWWVGDGESYLSGLPSVYYMDALEPSEVILWKKQDFDSLTREVPAIHEMSELLMARSLIASQNRIYVSNSQTAEEKYYQFLQSYPEFIRRVPLHMIASYLGVTRETLSRVRRQATGR